MGKAKASLATGKRNATDYANLCVEAASAMNTGDCSASTTADFRIKAIATVNCLNDNLTNAVRVMAKAVAMAAFHAESPKAAAAIARSAAKRAFASVLERREDIVGTPCENAFDTPQRDDDSEMAFEDAFAVIERLNLTDEESDNISAAVNAVFTVVRDQANAEAAELRIETAEFRLETAELRLEAAESRLGASTAAGEAKPTALSAKPQAAASADPESWRRLARG